MARSPYTPQVESRAGQNIKQATTLSPKHETGPGNTLHKRKSSQPRTFGFPTSHHLLITTPAAIYALDHHGIHSLFTSSRRGILAAKEAKDGTQVLAVADKHTVVLHDCMRNREKSWGLHNEDGSSSSHTRLLEYPPNGAINAGKLFLNTSLTGAIQCFSIGKEEGARIMRNVGKEHPNPPKVMAVSANGRYMLSASQSPTVVYLQDLEKAIPARLLHPRASEKAVVVASFHPERAEVFLLGFQDGTLTAYDITQIGEGSRSWMRPKDASQDLNSMIRELARFERLHRVMTRTSEDPNVTKTKSISITDSAFLPGYKSRAISAGADGKCRLVDFEAGGVVLRT